MILFYSDTCQHCAVLLDTIKRHDTKKTIKLVVIDTIVNKISHKITAGPALMFMPSKEIIYGKAVFDYLLLPNRGYLFSNNSTRDKQEQSSITSPIPLNKQDVPNEPMAFTLGSISSDNFSDITDDNINSMNINEDKLYKWGIINETSDNTTNNTNNTNININANNNTKFENEKSSKQLPSLDELQKLRENIFKDI
jgi:hypothetical protein